MSTLLIQLFLDFINLVVQLVLSIPTFIGVMFCLAALIKGRVELKFGPEEGGGDNVISVILSKPKTTEAPKG